SPHRLRNDRRRDHQGPQVARWPRAACPARRLAGPCARQQRRFRLRPRQDPGPHRRREDPPLMTHHPSHADDCERVLRILMEAPRGGMSLDEIKARTRETGEEWSLRTVNATLVALGNQVGHQKVRESKGGKVTKYYLKVGS